MNILVNLDKINDSIAQIEKNNQYLIINNNLFSMNKIITLKTPEDNLSLPFRETSFEFSYNDGCKNDIIKVRYFHEKTDCISFVKTCKVISENEVDQIIEKATKIAIEKNNHKDLDLSNDIDNIFYNEVLVYISSKINENDKSDLKDDFISKFEMFKEKRETIINNTKEAINNLYSKIIDIKLIGD